VVKVLKVVINSSPIIFLVRLQALELFLNDNYEFYITPSVVTEINAKSDEISRALTPVLAAEKLIVQSTNLTSLFNRLHKSFGRGESETIALAKELQADFVILDDLAARKIASNLGLNVKGTLAILKKLVVERKIEIDNKDEFYQNLVNIKFRISRSIFDAVFRDV
jgi:predicted nucleic acid-binding protein